MRFILLMALVAVMPLVAAAETLTIGTISDEPAEKIQKFKPLADYLTKQLVAVGIDDVRVAFALDIAEMADMMKAGRVDVFIDSAFTSLLVNRQAGSRMVLRRWKRGISEYRSVLFTRDDSAIKNLQDLLGKTLAFEEPHSSSSYILPRLLLARNHLPMMEVNLTNGQVASDKVGFVFSWDDSKTLALVLRGRVDAGAMPDFEFRNQSDAVKEKLKILAMSFFIPRHVVNLRNGISPYIEAAIIRELENMSNTSKGKEALEAFDKTAKFDQLTSEKKQRLEALLPELLKIEGME